MINGHCERTIHAEANVIINAARAGQSTVGTHMTTHGASPCPRCALLIAQAGIVSVAFDVDYTVDDGVLLLRQHGVRVVRIEE
jgi:dCMP deaminase